MAYPYDLNAEGAPGMSGNPREVFGRQAYWDRDPGRYIDNQTGRPLAERLAMEYQMSGAANPNIDRGGGSWVYGDSYGGVQGAEQAQLNAIRANILAQQKMQQDAYERERNRRDALDIARMRIAGDVGLRAREGDLNRMSAAEKWQALLGQRGVEEAGRNQRAYEKNFIDLYGNQQKANAKLGKIDEAGQSAVEAFNRLHPQVIEAHSALDESDSELEKLMQERDSQAQAGIFDVQRDGTVLPAGGEKTFLPLVTEMNRRLAQASRKASDVQDWFKETVKNVGPVFTKAQQAGYIFHPELGGFVNQQTGMIYPVNNEQPRIRQQPKSLIKLSRGSLTPI